MKEDQVVTEARQVGLTVDVVQGKRLPCYRFWVRDRVVGSAWTRSGAKTWLEGYKAALNEGHRRLVG